MARRHPRRAPRLGPAFAPEQVIGLLRLGKVTELSLDHDLGLEPGRTGYAVLVWLEREVAAGRWPGPLPETSVHSANPSAAGGCCAFSARSAGSPPPAAPGDAERRAGGSI